VEQAKKNVVSSFLVIILIAVFTIIVLTIMNNYFIPKQYYKASDFKIKTIYSKSDYNDNHIDDYSDFV
jgi:hypothetical protein